MARSCRGHVYREVLPGALSPGANCVAVVVARASAGPFLAHLSLGYHLLVQGKKQKQKQKQRQRQKQSYRPPIRARCGKGHIA